MVRFTIKVTKPRYAAEILGTVAAAGADDEDADMEILRLKNRLDVRVASPDGYRDTLANIRHKGCILELQVALMSMVAKKEEVHVVYEADRASSLPQSHLGDANDTAIRRVACGATRRFDIAGTPLPPARLAALVTGLSQPAVRLSEITLGACPGLKGVGLAAKLLTPEVCTVLGPGITLIVVSGAGVAGPIGPVFAALAAGGCGQGLKTLELDGNKLVGGLAGCNFGAFPKMKELQLWGNQLSGVLPPSIGEMAALETLSLSDNQLEGEIPPELAALERLKKLSLSKNQLEGEIPHELGKLERLKALKLGENKLTGNIPASLGGMVALEKLELQLNQLEGRIPPELAALERLKTLQLFKNKLTGNIPASLGGMAVLEELGLSCNQFEGEIPPELAALEKLKRLSLFENKLTGKIPASLGGIAALERLVLSRNQLEGGIPPELATLERLTLLDLESNKLTGPIPLGIAKLPNLESLELQNQRSAFSNAAEFKAAAPSTITKCEV